MERTSAAGALARCRAAFDRREWATAADGFTAAAQVAPLDASDLELLAIAGYLAGRDDASAAAWEQAHQAHLRCGVPARAARCAFWLGLALILRGDMARGGGWVARAQRIGADHGLDGPEQGFLMLPAGFATLVQGGAAAAYSIFEQAAAIGERFSEPDLLALARTGQGQALVRRGDTGAGVALLDEVMTAVTAGEVGPIASGIIYCAVIETCHDTFDLRRAHEWTAALSDWCAAQPELVPYRGQCLVHRCEVMAHAGQWADALVEVRLACSRLSTPTAHPALGRAMYQLGELNRLRGETVAAEAAYQRAGEHGHYPQPGLALLRLAQGRVDVALSAIRGAAAEVTDRLLRARILAAYVDIALAGEDLEGATVASEELTAIARDIQAPLLLAIAAHARAAVLLAAGDPRTGLAALHEAAEGWRALKAPYESARTRVLMGLARRALGDDDTAMLELGGARAIFAELGAAPDLERIDRLGPTSHDTSGLSPREVQVLRLVAAGRTNHAIAAELVLSQKTVERHLSNIYTKLGLSSRAAATAYAYEHQLI